jgi:hypothetical protein
LVTAIGKRSIMSARLDRASHTDPLSSGVRSAASNSGYLMRTATALSPISRKPSDFSPLAAATKKWAASLNSGIARSVSWKRRHTGV